MQTSALYFIRNEILAHCCHLKLCKFSQIANNCSSLQFYITCTDIFMRTIRVGSVGTNPARAYLLWKHNARTKHSLTCWKEQI